MSVSPAVIKKTQAVLGKHVKKPPLTEKLLKKPPFRFLHDVVSAVIKNHGVLAGLYDDAEMQSENVKEREAKIKYLDKAIACVSLAIMPKEPALTTKPAKVISGQEPERTNEFLQAIGKLISQKYSNLKHFRRTYM